MARITLIRPSVLVTNFTTTIGVVPPLGLAYIAGTLRASGHDVTCVDAPGEAIQRFRICASDPTLVEIGLSIPEIVDRVPENAEVIGLSCMFSLEWFYVIELIRALRARFPSQFIVLGGEHASADHEYILKNTPEVDACVLGEGENKILSLLEALRDGIPKRDLPGVAVLDPETGSVRKNPEKDGQYRILDIDAVPRPAWDLIPLTAYLTAGVGHGSVHYRAMPMLASRGCPHRCTFCSSPQMWTTRWKARDVDDILEEIKTYIRDYGINRVEFYDLSAIIDPKWIVEFCEKLLREKLSITWAIPAGTRTEGLSEEVLELIKKSGCTRLAYPLETGNPRVSELIKKKINYKRSLSSMRNAVRTGILVHTSVIFGFPFQTYWDIFLEYLYVIRLAWIGARDIMFHPFAPYPGSELHDQLVAEGKIVKDENYPRLLRYVFTNNYSDGKSWNPRMTPRALRMIGLFGMGEFYFFQFLFRPHRLVGLVYRLCAGKPATLLELGLSCTIPRFFRRSRIRLISEQSRSAA